MKEIKVKCLGCGSLEGGDFCGSCHTVLPIDGPEVDHFRLFGFTPRPAIDRDALKASFLDLSQKLHPDRNPDADEETSLRVLGLAAQLNRAYATLTDTKERLRYLVGSITDEEPREAKQVPGEMMELFFEVHDLMQEVDGYLKTRKKPASRIEAAMAMADDTKAGLLDRIEKLRDRSNRKVEAVEAEIADLDGHWDKEEERERLCGRLTELADILAYLGRLRTSLDEKELALSI